MRVALVLVLVACDAGQSPSPSPMTLHKTPRSDSAWLDPDPWAPVETAPSDAGVVKARVEADAKVVDPNLIQLTWHVYPPSAPANGEEPSMLQRVWLEVDAGGVTRAWQLPSELGSLQPYNQVVCGTSGYPLEKGELAKITFYEGGAGGFFVKRAGDVLTVFEWSQTDGACEGPNGDLVACPRSVNEVARIPVTAKRGAKVLEEIVEVDDRGDGRPIDCGAR